MTVHPSDVVNGTCDACGGPLRVDQGTMLCLDCGKTAGLVTLAAKLKGHHDVILAEIPTTTNRPRRQRRKPKALREIDQRDEPRLFASAATRPESYSQTRARVSVPPDLPRVPAPVIRRKRIRCVDCDRTVIIRSGKMICPKCGQILGDVKLMSTLRRQFPGSSIIDNEPDA